MAFVWKRYFKFSEDLVTSADTSDRGEEKYRISISRLYYSIYNPIRFALETQLGSIPRNMSTHKWVLDQLKSRGDDDENHKEAAMLLKRMQTKRESVDYDGHYFSDTIKRRDPSTTAHIAINEANRLYELLPSIQQYR